MDANLYNELKRIGVGDQLAHDVDKALDPAHVATKSDMVHMQEAILQTQLQAERQYNELKAAIDKVDSRIDKVDSRIDLVRAEMRTEVAAVSRQFWITFGGLIATILTVFLVNWYFHSARADAGSCYVAPSQPAQAKNRI